MKTRPPALHPVFIGTPVESGGATMPRTPVALALLCAASQIAAAQPPSIFTFDDDPAGAGPKGFEVSAMRQDTPGTWLVRRVGANGVLVHQPDPGAAGFALAIAPDTPRRDVRVSARLRLAGGTRAGGLVWRFADAAHYYAAILDLDKRELVLFRVTAGNRIFLESEDDLELDPEAWHTLRIVHDESRIDVRLGGIRVFQERDRRAGPRSAPGRSGVIAAGGSEVWFDDLRIEPDRDRRSASAWPSIGRH
ncbi:MAG: hypothetical protein HY654_08960 [Acidobacteria bacterium]|nr:hypothetical protein [Acidobacteriota bacterium]